MDELDIQLRDNWIGEIMKSILLFSWLPADIKERSQQRYQNASACAVYAKELKGKLVVIDHVRRITRQTPAIFVSYRENVVRFNNLLNAAEFAMKQEDIYGPKP